ncbi:hypothetical protein [Erythrobacter sp. KY5]|uniref:hypothetical protein n=1 Tax=Erythrobacter sp. KY5 TaxID=2011159 RepID=UPI0013A70452|nr:hypothetical protein [Erythrobacter sp. KY5]
MEEFFLVISMLLFGIGVPWLVVYLQSKRLAAVEVELRELSTLIKRAGSRGSRADDA